MDVVSATALVITPLLFAPLVIASTVNVRGRAAAALGVVVLNLLVLATLMFSFLGAVLVWVVTLLCALALRGAVLREQRHSEMVLAIKGGCA